MRNAVKIVIIDQQPIIRWGIKNCLQQATERFVVTEAESVEHATEEVASDNTHLIITEFTSHNCPELDIIASIRKGKPINTLAFTDYSSWSCVEKLISYGGLGYVLKSDPIEDLVSAVRAATSGQRWISPALRRMQCALLPKTARSKGALSPREQDVAALVARGFTSTQIAEQLCVTLKTIETHRYRIFKKLRIASRAQLVAYVLEHGLLRIPLDEEDKKC